MAFGLGGARSGLYRGPWSVFREAESDAGRGRSSGCDEMRITSRLERVEKNADSRFQRNRRSRISLLEGI
jgi:hypothetical protein